MRQRIIRYTAGGLVALILLAAGFWWWGWHTPPYPQPALTGKLEQRRIDAGGLSRSFLAYIPERMPAEVPVVLVLHGSGGTGARMRSQTAWAFEELADREGAIVVYPEAFGGIWNDCRIAIDSAARRRHVDDVAFLQAVVARLDGDPALAGRRVDTERVYAVGLSNGGQMALRLALEAPDFVAGVAAIAANLPVPDNSDCRESGQPVAVLLINGDADPISPYDGGDVRLFGPFGRRGAVRSSADTAEYFRTLAGYPAEPFEHRYPDADPADGTVATRRVWSAGDRPEVALITIHGGGHTIPHPVKTMPRVFGRTSHDVPAAEEIWRFFRRQLPAGDGPV